MDSTPSGAAVKLCDSAFSFLNVWKVASERGSACADAVEVVQLDTCEDTGKSAARIDASAAGMGAAAPGVGVDVGLAGAGLDGSSVGIGMDALPVGSSEPHGSSVALGELDASLVGLGTLLAEFNAPPVGLGGEATEMHRQVGAARVSVGTSERARTTELKNNMTSESGEQ